MQFRYYRILLHNIFGRNIYIPLNFYEKMKKSLVMCLAVITVFMSLVLTSAESNDGTVNAGVNLQVRADNANVRASTTTNVDTVGMREERMENRQAILDSRAQKIIEFRERIKERDGELRVDGRYHIQVRELSPEMRSIIAGKTNARTGLNLSTEDIDNKTMLRAHLSNGLQADVKIMPDRASAVALKRLRAKCAERNCTIELKEVSRGNKTMLTYEVQTDKDSRLFFIFKKRMMVRASVDAETGEIILSKKPWWAFLAKEQNAAEADIDAEVGLSTEANATIESTENN